MSTNYARPGDACRMSAASEFPTAFQLATEALMVTPEEENAIVDRPAFNWGWAAGFNRDLAAPVQFNVKPNDTEAVMDRRAWLVGFVSGYSARSMGYDTPFCVFDHDGQCANYAGR